MASPLIWRPVLAALAIGVCGTATGALDLCKEPLVIETARAGCRSEAILFRANGITSSASLVVVTTAYKRDYDVLSPILVYFLRRPDGDVVRLDKLPYSGDYTQTYAQRQIRERLGFSPGAIDPNSLYDRLIEELSGRYCMIFRMKSPFSGEIQDCDGGPNTKGSAEYEAGIITASQASRLICEHIQQETSQACGNNSVGIISNVFLRDREANISYRLVSRRTVKAYPELKETTSYGSSIPVEYDERIYELNARTGQISLLRQSAMLCGSGGCKPIAGR